MSFVLSELWPYLAGGLAIVAAYFGVRIKAKSDAKAEFEAKQNAQAVESMKTAQEVRNEINRLPSGAADNQLRTRWMRKRTDGQ